MMTALDLWTGPFGDEYTARNATADLLSDRRAIWEMLLPRRCAESEIARGELIALTMPEIRLRRQVRLVFRKGGERSHASAAFLDLVSHRDHKDGASHKEHKGHKEAPL